jgi:hypothetical protein
MDEAFELMLEPRRHRCLGARLEPLTLGHILLLQRLGSPFLSAEPVTAIRLFEAVFVCCQSHQRALVNMQKRWAPWLLWFWGWRHRRTDLEEESIRFNAYLEDNFAVARIKRKRHSNSPSPQPGAPWALRILVALMAEFHWPETVALDCPLIKANALLAAFAEARGDVQLWTQQDRDFFQWAKTQDQIKFGKTENVNGTP